MNELRYFPPRMCGFCGGRLGGRCGPPLQQMSLSLNFEWAECCRELSVRDFCLGDVAAWCGVLTVNIRGGNNRLGSTGQQTIRT